MFGIPNCVLSCSGTNVFFVSRPPTPSLNTNFIVKVLYSFLLKRGKRIRHMNTSTTIAQTAAEKKVTRRASEYERVTALLLARSKRKEPGWEQTF